MSGLFGRMAKGSGHHDWLSRDYLDITCHAVGCMFNKNHKCAIPAACKIGDDGMCSSFRPGPTPQKPDGD